MRKAIILHGMPTMEEYLERKGASQARQHWLPWLQQQYQSKGIVAELPEFPEPHTPVYEAWKATFEQFDIDEETDLIGHSCGAGFLIRWLSENKRNVGKVAFVAPWLDPDKEVKTGFFDFAIDTAFPERTKGVDVFISMDDYADVLASVDQLRSIPGLKIHTFSDRGHFILDDMHTEEFPELRDALLKDLT